MIPFIRSYIFIIIIQILIYSFLSEYIINIIDENNNVGWLTQTFILITFLLPLFFVYRLFENKKKIKYDVVLNPKSIFRLSVIFLVLPFLAIYINFKYDIFIRRIGTENVALIFSNLDFWSKIILRTYELSLIFFLLIALMIVKFKTNGESYRFLTIVFIFNLIYFLVFSLLNSRGSIFYLLFMVFALDSWFNLFSKNAKNKLKYFAIFFFITVSIIRYVPLFFIGRGDEINKVLVDETIYRLNCSENLNQVKTEVDKNGFLFGSSFQNPLTGFLAITGDEKAKTRIENANTGSKQYILQNVLVSDLRDCPSCIMIDGYANFGYLGFVFIFLFLLFWIFILYIFSLRKTLNSLSFTIILTIVYSTFPYELDGFALITPIFRFIPVFFIFVLINPLKLIKSNNG